MPDDTGKSGNALDKEREMREHERKAQEHDSDEGSPEERVPAEPGAPAFPAQKSPGS